MEMNKHNLVSTCVVVFLLGVSVFPIIARADGTITSKINGKELGLPETPQEYSFLAAGHVYGAPSPSAYPAASFLANIEKFKNMDADFFVMMGDIIQHQGVDKLGESEIHIFKSTVGDKLDIPIFNAPGNHDLSNRELYTKYFGKTFFSFRYSSELYIFLDSELNVGQIEGEQREFILNHLNAVKHSNDIKNIFIIIHQTLWAINNEPINVIDPWVNGGPHPKEWSSFEEYILPVLFTLSENKQIYLMSGDIGVKDYVLGKIPGAFPLFYQEDPKHNLTYIACGLGENEHDAIIKVDITREGEVTFSPISLIGKDLGEIHQYGIDYWSTKFAVHGEDNQVEKQEVRAYRRLLSKIKRVLTNKYFLLGNAFSFILIITIIGGFILFKKVLKP